MISLSTCKKLTFIAFCVFCLLGNRPASAMFIENFDTLHDAYALNSYIQPTDDDLTIYFKKLFSMNGAPTTYILTAYNGSWQIPFAPQAQLTVTVDGTSFVLTAQAYSRQIGNYWYSHTGYGVEFTFPPALIAALSTAKQVSLAGANLPSFRLSTSELQEWQEIIAQDHY